jgi:acetaldehyde dehydrogenase
VKANGTSPPLRVGIVGSGNIGTDLLLKLARNPAVDVAGVAGIDPFSDGLARARAMGVTATHDGLEDLLSREPGIELVFDATSAAAHPAHAALLADRGIRSVDLTPAALGPAVVPAVNLDEHRDAPDVNLVTCGAQATVPVVAALARRFDVAYAEAVSTVASRSAGPGTRQNIDEFTFATARSLEAVGGAASGKAIILLNPAVPPITMRNTVYVEAPDLERDGAIAAVEDAVAEVAQYVPGYRLAGEPLVQDGVVTVLLEVEGAGDYLPAFAGNLDIMTSAAVRVAELYAQEPVAG